MHQWDNKVTLVLGTSCLSKTLKISSVMCIDAGSILSREELSQLNVLFDFFFFNLSCSQKNIIQSSTE